ncbi:MAG: GT-D fold domain-containing glycosyltransferase [Syntrophomonadaceae bacterium]
MAHANPELLNSSDLMERISNCLNKKTPLAVVSVGATEAFVMAQYVLFSEEEILDHPEARVANWNVQEGHFHRGLRFPNVKARDAAIEAARQADIIGYNTIVKPARELAQRVFAVHNINPTAVFEAHLRRVVMISQKEKLVEMLQDKRLLLVGAPAPEVKRKIETGYLRSYNCRIVGAIRIFDFEEIDRVKDEIAQHEFDICFLAAGTNALILAPYISKHLGKVAFDIGHGMTSLATQRIVMDDWLMRIIGLDNIMKM